MAGQHGLGRLGGDGEREQFGGAIGPIAIGATGYVYANDEMFLWALLPTDGTAVWARGRDSYGSMFSGISSPVGSADAGTFTSTIGEPSLDEETSKL